MRALRSSWLPVATATALFALGGCCRQHSGTPPIVAVDGKLVPSPTALAFGNVALQQTKSLKLTLTNAGAGELGITSSKVTGPNAAEFAMVGKLPESLSPGVAANVSFTFGPQQAGSRTASLVIETDSTETPSVTVPLTGSGIDVEVCTKPTTLDFGNVQVQGTPATLPLTLTNCGKSPFDIAFNAIEGAQGGDFGATGDTNQTLQPNQSITVTVSYSPHAVGPSTADLPFTVCQGGCQQHVDFTGVGVDGQLCFSPDPVNFGQVPPGTSPLPTVPVTVTNCGTEPVSLTNDGTENNNGVFTITPAINSGSPIPLAVNGSTTITVAYAPTGQQGDQDQMLVTWSVADPGVTPRTANDPLSGNANLNPCSLTISPTSLGFGNVSATATVTKQVTLANGGQTDCQVTGIALSGSTDPSFSLPSSQASSLTVPAGGSATIGVSFNPNNSNTPLLRKGSLLFSSTDPAHANATVPLTAYINNNNIYAGGWPKWHADNGNTGQTEADTSALQGTVAWKFNVGAPSASLFPTTYINSPVVDATGNVYQVAMSGMLYALDQTGKKLWATQLSDPSGDPHPSTPALLANGQMFAISGSDPSTTSPPQLYLLDSTMGTVLASQPFGEDGFDACPGLGNDGTLFESDDDGAGGSDPYSAIAFQASGTKVTQLAGVSLPLTNESERFGIVIAADDTSYWGNNGEFFGVSPPAAGFKPLTAWPSAGLTLATNANDVNAAGSVVSDLALDAHTTGFLYAYSAWEDMDFNSGNYSVQGNLVAVDPATGATKWTVVLPSGNLPSGWSSLPSDAGNAAPAVADDGTVYVGNGDGLRAITGATGAVKWLFKTANVSSSPAIGGDGTVFFGVDDGSFYAVKPDGTLRFKLSPGSSFNSASKPISASPAIAGDGSVYVTVDDGFLYKIQ
ncbi:MAG: choice-of-anchor D domain-containing protein [Deltaproteobacteria bacterium]